MTMLPLDEFIIRVTDDQYELPLEQIIPISGDLSEEFTRQPSLYAYVATLAARVEAEWLDSKTSRERVYASTDKEVRKDLRLSEIKATEPLVKAEVLLRRGYVEAQDYEIECREQFLIMQAIVRTLDMRAQMLISLGAHLRAEAEQTGMLIKDTKKKLRDISEKVKKERVDAQRKRGKYSSILYGDDDGDEPPF